MKKIISLSFLVFTFVFSFSQNKKLPDISIPNIKGEQVKISDFGKNGKLTVMSFWATWCVPCKKELNNISEVYDDWKKQYNVEVVAISTDDARDAAKVKSYINGQSWDFTVLLDQNQDLKRALNFQTIPFTLLVDKNGNIVYSHSGYVEGDEIALEEKLKNLSQK